MCFYFSSSKTKTYKTGYLKSLLSSSPLFLCPLLFEKNTLFFVTFIISSLKFTFLKGTQYQTNHKNKNKN